eukprot:SAG11_NODE_2919_length_2837_cov_2.990504_3_plen_40_part_00
MDTVCAFVDTVVSISLCWGGAKGGVASQIDRREPTIEIA